MLKGILGLKCPGWNKNMSSMRSCETNVLYGQGFDFCFFLNSITTNGSHNCLWFIGNFTYNLDAIMIYLAHCIEKKYTS